MKITESEPKSEYGFNPEIYKITEDQFEKIKGSWEKGHRSSDQFLRYALAHLYRSHQKIIYNGEEREFRQVPTEQLHKNISQAGINETAYRLGSNGLNPPDETEKYFQASMNNWKYFSDRYHNRDIHPRNKINIRELTEIDPNLQNSLLAHGYVNKMTRKSYVRHEEEDAFEILRQAAHDSIQNDDEEKAILNYLICDGIISYANRIKIKAIIRLDDQPDASGNSPVKTFANFNEVAKSLYPLPYMDGWVNRLEKRKTELRDNLPEYLQLAVAVQSVKSGFFWRDDDTMFEVFKNTMESIKRLGDPSEALKVYAMITAHQIEKYEFTTLKPFEIKAALNIGDLINKFLALEGEQDNLPNELSWLYSEPVRPPKVLKKYTRERTGILEWGRKNEAALVFGGYLPKPQAEQPKVKEWTSEQLNQYLSGLLNDTHGLHALGELPATLNLSPGWQDALKLVREQNDLKYTLVLNRQGRLKFEKYWSDQESMWYERTVCLTDLGYVKTGGDVAKSADLTPDQIYGFLTDIKKTPLLAVTAGPDGQENYYVLMRSATTKELPEDMENKNRPYVAEYWVKQATTDANRSAAEMMCQYHNVALYEGKAGDKLTRIV